MSKILKVRNVNDYGRYLGAEEQHPLVSVIDYAEMSPIRHSLPTVQYCADKLCMSANYFGDVIKKTSLPRTGWRQGKSSPKCPTASASNIPSTSAGCSRSRRALRRRSIAKGYGVKSPSGIDDLRSIPALRINHQHAYRYGRGQC